MNEPFVIRASSLTGYADCSRRSAARMFGREIVAAGFTLRQTKPGIGSAVGTAVHSAASIMLAEKARTGSLPADGTDTDAAVDRVKAETADGVMFDAETPNIREATGQVVRMVRAYRSFIAPEIQPLLVEERLEAQVTPDIVLSGQADVIAREPGKIRDLKTGVRLGRHGPQIGAYSLLARSVGVEINSAAIDYVKRVRTTKPQPTPEVEEYEPPVIEQAAINVLRHIEADLRTFRQGDERRALLPGDPWAFLANPASNLCGPKYCPAHGTDFCREHRPEDEE